MISESRPSALTPRAKAASLLRGASSADKKPSNDARSDLIRKALLHTENRFLLCRQTALVTRQAHEGRFRVQEAINCVIVFLGMPCPRPPAKKHSIGRAA